MRTVGAEALHDPSYLVPAAAPAPDGVAWLRAHVVRFCDGADHERRRAVLTQVLAGLEVDVLPGGTPTAALLTALGLPGSLADDVAAVSASYQPHAEQSPAADAAADRLVEACGGRTELAAARVSVLVQAHAGTSAAIERRRTGDPRPAVPHTRRVAPDGAEVLVDLADAPFGAGPHACPGRRLAEALVDAATASGSS